jgi:hypothetical protein
MRARFVLGVVVVSWLVPCTSYGQEASYPPDVAQFIDRRDTCDHFRGEPYEDHLDRQQFIAQQLSKYCDGTDSELSELKSKYSGSSVIIDKLETYEPCIETSSNCENSEP